MITYQTTTDGLTADQLGGFFDGWRRVPTPEQHLAILRGSALVQLAIDDQTGRVVGFATSLTDGLQAAFMPLLEVLPGYRGQGIGSELVRRMLAAFAHLPAVDLTCDPALQGFYRRLGMAPSVGMVVRNNPGASAHDLGHVAMPKAATTVGALTMADYDEVLALWRACDGVGLNESDEPAPLAAFLARNRGLSLVLRVDGRVIGAVLCGHDGRRGYLHHLAVAPEHRGQGLGRLLVERCLASLAELGIAKCNVFLFADNDEGARFWPAVGFGRRTDLLVLQSSTMPSRGSLSP